MFIYLMVIQRHLVTSLGHFQVRLKLYKDVFNLRWLKILIYRFPHSMWKICFPQAVIKQNSPKRFQDIVHEMRYSMLYEIDPVLG